MKGNITMSGKEADRIAVLEKVIAKQMKQKEAARILGLSSRQIIRIKKRYRRLGATGLVHLSRGRASNHHLDQKLINRAICRIRERYGDFGPTLAWEHLTEEGTITFSPETLRKAMVIAGIWKPKRQKRPVIHQLRQRRDMEGELVQIDGSPHDWFEERVDSATGLPIGRCTLLVFIDDATSKLLHLEFVPSESTNSYLTATRHYLERHGKPVSFYSDKHGVLRVNTTHGCSSGKEDSNGLTQFGTAMNKLGIGMIFANSPEAKGRVEKANQTLQDRLIKEMRLKDISSLAAANYYLPEFMGNFNRKFAVLPKSPVNAHRPLLPAENLDQIICQYHCRILSKNLSLRYQNKIYQVITQRPAYAMRRARVQIQENPQGQIKIIYQDQPLDYRILSLQPKAEIIDSKHLNLKVEEIKQTIKPLTVWERLAEQQWEQYASV